MGDFEKRLNLGADILDSEEYKNAIEMTDIDNNDGINSDDEYSKNYIIGRLFEAQDILRELIDYLENSDYALENGGETFKRHLEKVNKINDELEHFWDE